MAQDEVIQKTSMFSDLTIALNNVKSNLDTLQHTIRNDCGNISNDILEPILVSKTSISLLDTIT